MLLAALTFPSHRPRRTRPTGLVTLRIGLTQDWDTLNPTAGFSVPSYEVWNVHYATLTDKAADDFAAIPGLAESWEASDDGLTYTYTLREGLLWSDGEPLTAEDVAWNVNTSRDQGWDNMYSTVQNLEATVIDARTVQITSAVPDPKLPTMDIYLVPKHIWEPIATDYDTATQYPGASEDGVGSGPFVVTEFTKGQSVIMDANPNYWGWQGEEPPYDQNHLSALRESRCDGGGPAARRVGRGSRLPAELVGQLGVGSRHRGRRGLSGWVSIRSRSTVEHSLKVSHIQRCSMSRFAPRSVTASTGTRSLKTSGSAMPRIWRP